MKKKIIYIILILAIIAVVAIRLKSNKETTKNKVYHFNKELPVHVQADTLKLESVEIETPEVAAPAKKTKKIVPSFEKMVEYQVKCAFNENDIRYKIPYKRTI